MGDDLVLRPATDADTDRIIGLLKASLGEGSIPRSEEYWSWKHARNPFGPSPALVAEADGRLVGLRVFMRWNWERDGQEVAAVRAVDTATHPDWQGKGIFTRLTLGLVERMREEGVAFVFNTPNQYSRPGYLKMGWSSVGRTSLWIRPLRPLRLVRSLRRKASENGAGFGAMEGYSIQEQLDRPEIERLFEGRRDPRFSTRRSREYLRWRYLDPPGFTYHAAGHWGEGAEALVVFRLRSRKGLRELRLCEVLTGPGPGVVKQAASLIRGAGRAAAADFAVAMSAAGTPERRALLRAGFLPAPRLGPILTVRALSTGADEDYDLSSRSAWRLAIGDLELF